MLVFLWERIPPVFVNLLYKSYMEYSKKQTHKNNTLNIHQNRPIQLKNELAIA